MDYTIGTANRAFGGVAVGLKDIIPDNDISNGERYKLHFDNRSCVLLPACRGERCGNLARHGANHRNRAAFLGFSPDYGNGKHSLSSRVALYRQKEVRKRAAVGIADSGSRNRRDGKVRSVVFRRSAYPRAYIGNSARAFVNPVLVPAIVYRGNRRYACIGGNPGAEQSNRECE